MYDLGFPTDAIDVLKDLCTESYAKVRLLLSGGHTESIPLKRGTIQGDTLPPLLFLIYKEPLLQWLHGGRRGYEHGCKRNIKPQTDLERLANRISGAFADDLICLKKHQNSRSPRTSRKAILLLRLGCPHCLREKG